MPPTAVSSVEPFYINRVASATRALICMVTFTVDLSTLKSALLPVGQTTFLPISFSIYGSPTPVKRTTWHRDLDLRTWTSWRLSVIKGKCRIAILQNSDRGKRATSCAVLWLCHFTALNLWRLATATPSQLQSIIILWSVPNSIAWYVIFSLPISTFSGLGVSHVMRYINLRYLLTYLPESEMTSVMPCITSAVV